ncbi:putative transposase [Thiocapsa rosea]|uniref:Putative transposase n=1 Tax=Thiocapsa rosea TaxID=69360 RepID=A0A495V919_9GAMM|nr:putative transposase [Thiocapsa rosea]
MATDETNDTLILNDPPEDDGLSPDLIDTFIARWAGATGTERANYQLFLTELCALLGLPQPDPARQDTHDNAYCFERRVVFQHGDGTESHGFIDLYRRTCYVLECKQTGLSLDTGGWDKAMLRAHGQAVQYVRALPAAEGRPPFVVVVDVGRSIELYSEFSLDRILETLMAADWVVYSKPCLARTDTVVNYLGRYSHRIALSDRRLVDFDGASVQLSYKDYRDGDRRKVMTLTAEELIRRFLLHVLPKGFMRVRHFGFLANRCRARRLAEMRTALSAPPPEASAQETPAARFDGYPCPKCPTGKLQVRGHLAPTGRAEGG